MPWITTQNSAENTNTERRWCHTHLMTAVVSLADSFKYTRMHKRCMRMQSCKKQDWNSPSGQGWSVHLQSSISHLISKKKKKKKNSFASLWKRPCMNYWCERIGFRELRRPSAPSSAERTGTALTETDTSQDSSVLPLWNVLPLHCSCCFSVLMATTTRLGMRGRSVHAGGLYAPAPGFHPTLCTGWQEAGTGQPNAEIF